MPWFSLVSSFLLLTSWSDVYFLLYIHASRLECSCNSFIPLEVLHYTPFLSTFKSYIIDISISNSIVSNNSTPVVDYIFLALSIMLLLAILTPFFLIVFPRLLAVGARFWLPAFFIRSQGFFILPLFSNFCFVGNEPFDYVFQGFGNSDGCF